MTARKGKSMDRRSSRPQAGRGYAREMQEGVNITMRCYNSMGYYKCKEILRRCATSDRIAGTAPQARWPRAHGWGAWLVVMVALSGLGGASLARGQVGTGVLLPDGREFVSWERPLQFTKTYYVDNRNPRAADSNPGTKELPFLTINKAAQVLQPGERVVIMTGVYRERVDPRPAAAAGPTR